MYSTALYSSDQLTGLTRALSSGTSYTVITAINNLFSTAYGSLSAGICISDGTKFIQFCASYVSGYSVVGYEWTNDTTYSGTKTFNVPLAGATPTIWLKLVQNGTDRLYYFSIDGINWIKVYSEAYNTYLTETVSGICICPDTGATTPNAGIQANFLHWSGA
jgi:hypothetical protein